MYDSDSLKQGCVFVLVVVMVASAIGGILLWQFGGWVFSHLHWR